MTPSLERSHRIPKDSAVGVNVDTFVIFESKALRVGGNVALTGPALTNCFSHSASE